MLNYRASKYLLFISFTCKAKKLYEKMFRNVLKELHLTQSEAEVILFLYNNKSLDTPADIAEYRSLSKSLISKAVNSLLKKGYLSYKEQESTDKRYNHLKLEDKAIPTIKKLKIVRKNFRKILSQGITNNELNVLMNVLTKLEKNVSNKLKNTKKNKLGDNSK